MCAGDIKKVMQQMFEGLFFIHNNKIIHRDMKAANILITRQVPYLPYLLTVLNCAADFSFAQLAKGKKSRP
jgi:serine/threonine protein kinase